MATSSTSVASEWLIIDMLDEGSEGGEGVQVASERVHVATSRSASVASSSSSSWAGSTTSSWDACSISSTASEEVLSDTDSDVSSDGSVRLDVDDADIEHRPPIAIGAAALQGGGGGGGAWWRLVVQDEEKHYWRGNQHNRAGSSADGKYCTQKKMTKWKSQKMHKQNKSKHIKHSGMRTRSHKGSHKVRQ
eukprot:TRINITY_DN18674_c0_g1_i1.p1 TRINITY_DN18674_c0_g1~~TRINITY_DN18674_c0_g1_i1.p1  ORF type:complete len:191 (+),score=40.58 TRINITY_DN18674_c0_g1_i1:253-825(+)